MAGIVRALVAVFADMLRSRAQPEAEVLVLRHQLNVALRKCVAPGGLTNFDRAFLVWLFRFFRSVLTLVRVVKPATVVRWHRLGFQV